MADQTRTLAIIAANLLILASSPCLADGEASDALRAEVQNIIRNPVTLNAITQPIVQSAAAGPLNWLDDLDLSFKYFDANKNGQNPSFGMSYRFARQIAAHDIRSQTSCEKSCKVLGLDLTFNTLGNVAFDSNANPANFLQTKVAAGLFGATGGPTGLQQAAETTDELRRTIEQDIRRRYVESNMDEFKLEISSSARNKALADGQTKSEADAIAAAAVNSADEAILTQAAKRQANATPVTDFQIEAFILSHLSEENVQELAAAEQRLETLSKSHLDDLFVGELTSEVDFESNQTFSDRQFVYGGRFSLTMQGYSALYADKISEVGWIGWINVPDWGPAVLRAATFSGPKECAYCILPRGATFPIVSAGIGYVDPQSDASREALGVTGGYPRFDFEASFSTLAFRIANTEVNLSADFRLYREIDPPFVIKNAGLDDFNFLALTLGPRNGIFVGYSVGQLPFDLQSQQTVTAGFKADIDAIRKFFLN